MWGCELGSRGFAFKYVCVRESQMNEVSKKLGKTTLLVIEVYPTII